MQFGDVWTQLRIQGHLDLTTATGIPVRAVITDSSVTFHTANDQDRSVSKDRFKKWFHRWFDEGKRNNSDFRNESGKRSEAKNFRLVKRLFMMISEPGAEALLAHSRTADSDASLDTAETRPLQRRRREDGESTDLSILLEEIHDCRLCPSVVPSHVPRSVIASWDTDLVLMAQAPSEHGVRVSGVHWIDSGGNLRPPGGTYLESYLRRIGYSIDPRETELPRPYTTNVLQCWPGPGGKRDRAPKPDELKNCRKWWKAEFQLLKPKAVLLLGKPAADAFAQACGITVEFASMLETQGATTEIDGFTTSYFTVPHPTAPYRGSRGGRGEYYDLAFLALKDHFAGAD